MGDRRKTAVVAITRRGAALATEVAAGLDTPTGVYVARGWAEEVGTDAIAFDEPLADRLATLFREAEGIVLVLALGATVRLVAPLLSDKRDDPAVVAVDEAGRFAISVVGGHAGGANALAERVADAIGATAVVSTASDSLGLPAVDLLGREHGWRLDAPRAAITRLSTASVNGELVGVFQDAGERQWLRRLPDHWRRFENVETLAAAARPAVVVTDRDLGERDELLDRWVVYRPRTLVLGIGCSTGASADEIEDLARLAVHEAGLSWESVAVVATINRRLQEPGVVTFAQRTGLELRGFAAEALGAVQDLPSPSAEVARHVGTPGVCEPAALLASGGSELVVPKRKSARATVAVARRAVAESSRGRLTLVGLGPGSPDLLAPRARRELREADVVVGYRAYLEPLRAWLPEGRLLSYELGEELERAKSAIDLARGGSRVVLVSSGDVGIYGMAGPALALLAERGDDVDSNAELPVSVVPGITAASAAAALLGAPLMLDFAAISLSDLLVPWERIERRLSAAAAGDLVVVLYNPASTRRRRQLVRAVEILLEHRPVDTPVGIVREAERAEQSVGITQLGQLSALSVDMKTVLIVGNSDTVQLGDRLVTRRGYRLASRESRDG